MQYAFLFFLFFTAGGDSVPARPVIDPVVASATVGTAGMESVPLRIREVIQERTAWRSSPDGYIPVYIKTKNPMLTIERLRAGGAKLSPPVDDIVPARLPPILAASLRSWEEVVQVEAAPYHRLMLDNSVPDIRADLVQSGDDLSRDYMGDGVILGIVDTGMEWSNPDFLDSSGHTRCLWLWNQQANKPDRKPPQGFYMGNECSREEMEAGDCQSADWMGHGTHCCGIMGSNNELYTGVAPHGEYVVVAVMDFAFLVDAVRYVFKKAEESGRPAVVNLSLGGHDGPHDGTSMEAASLDRLTGPGKIIVAAAGNEGSDFIHLSYELEEEPKKTRVIVTKNSMPVGSKESAAVINIWAEQESAEFSVEMRDQHGNLVGASEWISGKDSRKAGTFEKDGVELGAYLLEAWGGPSAANGKYAVRVTIAPSKDPDTYEGSGYGYYLLAKGSGRFHAWCLEAAGYRLGSRFQNRPEPGTVTGDNEYTVGMPATGKKIIAVAAYNTKNQWTDIEGQEHTGDWQVGTIASFSSKGPSVDPSMNGTKPEIAAPGQIIASTASAVSANLFGKDVLVDERHVLMQGTSMACPHVSGAVALLLEADPTLDPERVEHILTSSARLDDFTGGTTPSKEFGFGKLDVRAALSMLEKENCETVPDHVYIRGECATMDEFCRRKGSGWRAEGRVCVKDDALGGCSSSGKCRVPFGSLTMLLLIAVVASRGFLRQKLQ